MKHRFKNFQNFWRDFSANKVAVVALFIFSLILFVAIFAPLVSPTDPYDLNTVSIMNSRLPPLSEDFPTAYLPECFTESGDAHLQAPLGHISASRRHWAT